MTLTNLLQTPYKLINLIFAGIILCVFLYSAAFSPGKGKHPIPSNYRVITGEEPLSSGLSRGFSAAIRLQFNDARAYNPYSLRIFSFFAIQLGLRIFFLLTYSGAERLGVNRVIMIDSVISAVFFILFFEPFWRNLY